MFEWGIPNATLFFVCTLLILLFLWNAWSRRHESTEADQIVRIFLILLLSAGAVVFLPSLLIVQKWLTKLALPVGLLWLGLIVLGAALWRREARMLGVFAWALWLLLTLAGNDAVSRRLLASLEREYAGIDPLAVASRREPFDLVVALGGATHLTPAGQVGLTDSGDRAVVAARLYNAGEARMLATTGEPNVAILGEGRHPAEEVRQLWESLGIPRDAMLVLEGATTKEELEAIAQTAEARGFKRIGVVTSAWHMSRATRLAEAAGLTVEPLPSDFSGIIPDWERTSFIPQAQSLEETSRALKEYLARLVGR